MLVGYKSLISRPRASALSLRPLWISLLLTVVLSACAIPPWAGPDVVVVVSDTTPAYTRVADALHERVPAATRVIQLHGNAAQAQAKLRAQAQGTDTIVAIGALALQTARQVQTDGRIVFCQVFNYEQPGLLAPNVSGVKAMPPLAKQFSAWKLLDPKLRRLALITGPGLHDLPSEAKRAAAALGLEVVHLVVHSDKELMYAARDRLKGADGIWIAPDHRVLSTPALRELLIHAVRQGTAVMVFNHQLLDEGAVMSAESDYAEIADRVAALVRAPTTRSRLVGLTRAHVKINDLVAARLGLSMPPMFERGIHVF